MASTGDAHRAHPRIATGAAMPAAEVTRVTRITAEFPLDFSPVGSAKNASHRGFSSRDFRRC